MLETVYENATKVDKRITYTITESVKPRTVVVKAGGVYKMPPDCGFRITKSETVE